MPKPQHMLLCTIGTSLLYPNLSNLTQEKQTDPDRIALAKAYSATLAQTSEKKDWSKVANLLHKIEPTDRLCGAEINSVTDLIEKKFIEQGQLHLFHSETDDGKVIAEILKSYFTKARWSVKTHCVEGLRDDQPESFRTKGLRNLAKLFGEQVRESRKQSIPCAINATGGYKAQIAIAVLMGQALDIPVYYKHERFDAIIPFPPMPVALDFSLWERASGMFMVLGKTNACERWERFKDDWDERFEPLVNRERIDSEDCLELSATGQIFHETFLSRFQQSKVTRLPDPATRKENPKLRNHNYKDRQSIYNFLEQVTKTPYVESCYTTYSDPDCPESTRFRLSGEQVEGIYSNGTWCVKFNVITTATDSDQLPVIVADLNDWLDSR